MDLKTYLVHQREEMLRYKWIESQKAGHDLGEQALREWVEKYGKAYREAYVHEYKDIIEKVAADCEKELKEKLPGVSDTLWKFIFTKVIDKFTEQWTKDACKDDSAIRKRHLEEI